jgi:hypothetical protein
MSTVQDRAVATVGNVDSGNYFIEARDHIRATELELRSGLTLSHGFRTRPKEGRLHAFGHARNFFRQDTLRDATSTRSPRRRTQSSAVPDTPADTFDARFGDFSARPRSVRIRICSALSHLPRIYARAAAGGKGDANNPTAALDERHTGPLATRLPQPTTMDACA